MEKHCEGCNLEPSANTLCKNCVTTLEVLLEIEREERAALESQLQEADKQATIHKDRIVALSAELQVAQDRVKELELHIKIISESWVADRIKPLEAENAALRADNAGLRNCGNCKWNDWEDWDGDKPCPACESCESPKTKWESKAPNPGDSLFQELESLRVVRDVAAELFYMVTNFGDFRNGNSYNGIDEGEVMAGKAIAKLEKALAAAKGVD